MSRCDDVAAKQRDLALARRFLPRGVDGRLGLYVGKLLVAHLRGLLQDPGAGRLRQAVGIVDSLGNGIAGDPQFVRNILDSDFSHLAPLG